MERDKKGRFKKGSIPISFLNLPREEIIPLYRKGDSADKISKNYGCDAGAVLRILKKNNIVIRPPNHPIYHTKKSIEKMKKTFVKIGMGWTKRQINLLKENYHTTPNKELAKKINKKTNSITWKANRLGLYKPKGFHSKMFSGKNSYNYEKKVTKETRRKLSLSHHEVNGEKNPNWRGGIAYEPYDFNFNKQFKNKIRKRDNQVCMLCGIHREKLKRALAIHHINYYKTLTIEENCISLCPNCHSKTNGNRNHWIKLFQSILSERYGYRYNNEREVILEVLDE